MGFRKEKVDTICTNHERKKLRNSINTLETEYNKIDLKQARIGTYWKNRKKFIKLEVEKSSGMYYNNIVS